MSTRHTPSTPLPHLPSTQTARRRASAKTLVLQVTNPRVARSRVAPAATTRTKPAEQYLAMLLLLVQWSGVLTTRARTLDAREQALDRRAQALAETTPTSARHASRSKKSRNAVTSSRVSQPMADRPVQSEQVDGHGNAPLLSGVGRSAAAASRRATRAPAAPVVAAPVHMEERMEERAGTGMAVVPAPAVPSTPSAATTPAPTIESIESIESIEAIEAGPTADLGTDMASPVRIAGARRTLSTAIRSAPRPHASPTGGVMALGEGEPFARMAPVGTPTTVSSLASLPPSLPEPLAVAATLAGWCILPLATVPQRIGTDRTYLMGLRAGLADWRADLDAQIRPREAAARLTGRMDASLPPLWRERQAVIVTALALTAWQITLRLRARGASVKWPNAWHEWVTVSWWPGAAPLRMSLPDLLCFDFDQHFDTGRSVAPGSPLPSQEERLSAALWALPTNVATIHSAQAAHGIPPLTSPTSPTSPTLLRLHALGASTPHSQPFPQTPLLRAPSACRVGPARRSVWQVVAILTGDVRAWPIVSGLDRLSRWCPWRRTSPTARAYPCRSSHASHSSVV